MDLIEYTQRYFDGATIAISQIDKTEYRKLITEIVKLKKRNGRLFLLGVGGSAANCSHAVNDFRKICHIETYTPTDNVSELTARVNDYGWDTVFIEWLKISHISRNDCILVFSVSGGDLEKNVSSNIVSALKYAKEEIGSTILGIVSRDGGYTQKVADVCVLIPVISNDTVTPYAESFQALLWHGIVNYPDLKD